MKKLVSYFLQGILYIAPISVTIYVIYAVFTFIDSLLQDWIYELLDINIPGLGVFLIIALLIVIGFFGQTIIAKPFKLIFAKVLKQVPFLRVVYSAFNDLFSAFVGKERKFNKAVLVKVNLNSDLEKLGFLTEEDLSLLGQKDKVAVYFPHSYNFSGELFIVPKDQVRTVDIPPAQVMKFVVSGGVAGWDSLPKELEEKK